jgi:hypothetical protein
MAQLLKYWQQKIIETGGTHSQKIQESESICKKQLDMVHIYRPMYP